MPHFGLIDEDALGPVESELMRARLHLRCGRRRLREGKTSLGILTLYDAFNTAMRWFISQPDNRNALIVKDGDDLLDDKTVYEVLKRSGILDGKFDYTSLNNLADEALNHNMDSYDFSLQLKGIESVMMQLGVMPFDENTLPPEDPSTP